MTKGGFVYIMVNKLKTTMYIGVTSNLKNRVWEHAHHEYENSFTSKYNIEYLVYYEWFDNIENAIQREKIVKKWRRSKKDTLVSSVNKDWRFLNEEVYKEIYSLLYN
ncbi:MAG: GIY-YIG nuclease family protein [Niabella sp.]